LKLPLTVAIIQARMASSRLPGKVLLDIAGKAMLQWVVERTRLAKSLDAIVVATSTDPADDPIAEFCAAHGYACTRGSLHDVLDRYYHAAVLHGAYLVVRLTADCPLLDPGLIDQTVRQIWGAHSVHTITAVPWYDFTANRLPPPWGRMYPIGLDVEVATFNALETAWREATAPHQREHVMPFIYENADRFKISVIHHDHDYGSLRWTVDTSEDLAALRALVPLLPRAFTWLDVLRTWQAHPEIAALNAAVPHKTVTDIDTRAS